MEQDDIIEVYQEQIVVAAEEGGKTEQKHQTQRRWTRFK